jgi:tetratricopeptide (TPR) repeat protein
MVMSGLLCSAAALGCDGALTPEAARWLQAANAAYVRGDDAAAVDEATRFLQLHAGVQEAGEAYYVRGLAHCRAGDLQAARSDLAAAAKATRRKDLAAMAHAKLGDMAYRSGDLEEAEKRYRAALDAGEPEEPPADEAMYRLGCVLQHDGRWGDADAEFDRLMHFFPRSPLSRLAKLRVRARRWSVQAAALRTVTAAAASQRRLHRAGLSSRVDLELRNGRMMRLVRVGSYQSQAEAAADLARVQAVFPDAYTVPAR